MKHHYILSELADAEIGEIVDYIAHENPKAAEDFVDSLYETFDMLSENPEIGHLREDLTDQEVKFWPFRKNFLVIYKPAQPLEIVLVTRAARDVPSIL